MLNASHVHIGQYHPKVFLLFKSGTFVLKQSEVYLFQNNFFFEFELSYLTCFVFLGLCFSVHIKMRSQNELVTKKSSLRNLLEPHARFVIL